MYQGSCLCGKINISILEKPKAVGNCHCKMCQKQHGAAFATYGSILAKNVEYLSGKEYLESYNSSHNVQRKFCKVCGSNIEWSGSNKYPDWVSIPLCILDTEFIPETVDDYFVESKCGWV